MFLPFDHGGCSYWTSGGGGLWLFICWQDAIRFCSLGVARLCLFLLQLPLIAYCRVLCCAHCVRCACVRCVCVHLCLAWVLRVACEALAT